MAQNKRLTTTMVKNAVVGVKDYEIRDSAVPGFILRVYRSGRKSYAVRYTAQGHRTCKTLGDARVIKLAAARDKARQILTSAKLDDIDTNQADRDHQRQEAARKAHTFGVFIDEYWYPYAVRHIRSHKPMLAGLRRNFSFLWDKQLSDITELDIERWRRRRAKGPPPVTFETIQRDIASLKAALNTAATEFRLIPASPLQGYRLRRRTDQSESTNARKIRYLTQGDEDLRLREALARRDSRLLEKRGAGGIYADHLTPIVLLALLTGLDFGDLAELSIDHIDYAHQQIRKQRKKISHKGAPRVWTIPLSGEAMTILKQWLAEHPSTSLVFPGPKTGRPMRDVPKSWQPVLDDAGVTAFRFKDLRHTFASWLMMGGTDLNTVRELMCHTDTKTTLIYVHLSPGHKEDAIKNVFGD